MLGKVHLDKLHSHRTKVILVRHGRSTYNEQGRYQGSCDASVLTEKGKKSAYQTGLALNHLTIDAIYTSPLQRTQQTARKILRALVTGNNPRPSLFTNAKLQELAMHQWEGLAFREVKQKFPQAYHCWKHTPHQFQMTTSPRENTMSKGHLALATSTAQVCFPVIELYQQARQFWQEILPYHLGHTLLVVSHGGTNRALISTALGLAPSHFHTLQQCNCGISVLEFTSFHSLSARLENLNLSNHLGKTLPKLKEGRQGLRLLLLPTEQGHLSVIKSMAQFLQDIVIDFSISSGHNSQAITAQILEYHPATVQLEISWDDFSQVWQQAIGARSQYNSDLTTGLVVAPPEILKR
ncbi:MAG: histidine phosphatase family protein, partial [Xenococcaceae cyanobacterium MO_234.B1]|nr:histidine phosphatase family protein [Xenococcaceae cyanobacterium MO_234.B1]